jgi:hypothetical protein
MGESCGLRHHCCREFCKRLTTELIPDTDESGKQYFRPNEQMYQHGCTTMPCSVQPVLGFFGFAIGTNGYVILNNFPYYLKFKSYG